MKTWTKYIPLTYLTDRFCIPEPEATSKRSGFMLDNDTGALVTVEQQSRATSESKLTFEEWYQAWIRLLYLIKRYWPFDHDRWMMHFERIRLAPDLSSNWPTWLAYDISVRRQIVTEKIDPGTFHQSAWSRIDAEVTRLAYRPPPSNNHNPKSLNRNPSTSFRHNDRQQGHHFRPQQTRHRAPTRCLLCAGPHNSRFCAATTQANGRPLAVTTQDNGKSFSDAEGNRYCFPFNGSSGCTVERCPKGLHHCTLCKAQNHGAQSCPSF